MATFAVVVAQAVAALSLSQVREMPASAAGNVILGDVRHGEIESFEYPTGGMLPIDAVEGQLSEKPDLLGAICIKRVWTVLFRAAPGADIGTATPETKRDEQEIALAINKTCPSGRYVHLNPGVSIEHGSAALARLKYISAPSSHTQFICSDETSSGLCAGGATIRNALGSLQPWLITGSGNEVLLGAPGRGITTQVDLDPIENGTARVRRFAPAPF